MDRTIDNYLNMTAWNKRHGLTHTPLYNVWNSMRQRCGNPIAASYPYYGGRGITVCERWALFDNFLSDMGPRPTPKHQIDRIDNNGPYSPENCRWALRSVQAQNKRNNRAITANGETLLLADWARRLGCSPSAILSRIKAGMPEADAVTKPIPARPNSKLRDEEAALIRVLHGVRSGRELAREFGVDRKTIANIVSGRIFADVKPHFARA